MPSKVRVYGKAQNRTALGIAHAYMVMYPQATLEDLRKAFPNELNPDKGTKENFIYVEDKGTTADWDGYFKAKDEVLTMGDGRKVSVVKMWTKPSFERIVEHAKLYDIEIARFDPAEKGFGKKGSFHLEYLNGYVPPVPAQSQGKSKKWLWILLAIVAVAIILWLLLGRKSEPQIVEVEKVIEKEVVVHDTITVLVEQIAEIERNFNNAQFAQGKADLSDDAKFVLHDLAKVLQQNPELRLIISGHTSSEGDPAFNKTLSQARAQSAVDFLVNKEGIDAVRLTAVGYGSEKPISDVLEENRRTEFEIVE